MLEILKLTKFHKVCECSFFSINKHDLYISSTKICLPYSPYIGTLEV